MPGQQNFTCRACGAEFDAKDKLDQHNRREHSVNQADGGVDNSEQSRGQRGSQPGQQASRGRNEPADDDFTG